MSKTLIHLTTPLHLKELELLRTGDSVLLSGIIYTGRDAAHLRFHEDLSQGKSLPFDPAGQVIYYVGPTPAKPGEVIGSCGPTTASRMDPYTPLLIERGLRGMIGKGNRSQEVKKAMLEYGCVYFGSIEGTAALIGRTVTHAEVIAYEDLGAEAVYRFTVQEMPLLVVNDLHGGDLYLEGQKKYRRI